MPSFKILPQRALRALEHNLSCLGLGERSRLRRGNAWRPRFLACKKNPRFSLVFVDPPYASVMRGRMEDLLSALKKRLAEEALIIVRLPPDYILRPEKIFLSLLAKKYGMTRLHIMRFVKNPFSRKRSRKRSGQFGSMKRRYKEAERSSEKKRGIANREKLL